MNFSASIEKLLAGRWIAGYYPKDALERTRLFNTKGISTLINFLGEDLTDRKKIAQTVSTYSGLISSIKERGLRASISLKPTQIGLNVSYGLMLSNYLKLARSARAKGVFVWLDMEMPGNVDYTIKAYKKAVNYQNTGICIQAYLKRSEKDIENLQKYGAKIRLVKGAYKTDGGKFESKREINHNYNLLMRKLFDNSNDFMIATHDSRIIEEAIKLNRKSKKRVTYAMLNGIRNKYAKYLAKHGNKVSIYVPFGSEWLSYGYRRLSEQGHASLIIRSLLERQSI